MASHAGQQHAPAFGQAARASGPTDGRTAARPSHRQGASEARGDPELPTLLRVYIDGPHGVGKTTTSAQLMEALGPRDDIVYVPEPMTYWQVLGASETLTNIYNTQHRLDRGEISAGEAAVVMTSAQITMSTPYAATDAVLAPHIGGEAVGPQAPPPALTLVFDRHPIASLLCYPAARYLMGSMTPRPCWRSWPSCPRPRPARTWSWVSFRRPNTPTAWPDANARASGLTWPCCPPFAVSTIYSPTRCGTCSAAGGGGRTGAG
uniref:Truncated thymidine kinase n=1 Tax=Human herpesvirus 2 TaxID=10310 RepID=A0A4Y5QKQ6_HHV2|nr:truncated thymidine kinase [Human alphaherpesvirus 2]